MGFDILSGNGIPFDLSGMRKPMSGGGRDFSAGSWHEFVGVTGAIALDSPAVSVGDLLVAWMFDINSSNMTSTTGGWTSSGSPGGDEVWTRIADGTAADTYNFPAMPAGAHGGAMMIVIPMTEYTSLGARWNGGSYPGSPNWDFRVPAQADNDPGNPAIILLSGKRWAGSWGPYDFSAGPSDPDVQFVATDRVMNGGTAFNFWCGFNWQDVGAATIDSTWNNTPADWTNMYAWSFRQKLNP